MNTLPIPKIFTFTPD